MIDFLTNQTHTRLHRLQWRHDVEVWDQLLKRFLHFRSWCVFWMSVGAWSPPKFEEPTISCRVCSWWFCARMSAQIATLSIALPQHHRRNDQATSSCRQPAVW